MKLRCFPPVSTKDARILILGSMPGEESLRQQKYYAYPHNHFWPIMAELFSAEAATYEQRIALLKSNKIALWDVLKHCHRKGSLDAKIKGDSIITNDFVDFLARHPHITHIFFNGTKAEKEFMGRVYKHLPEDLQKFEYRRLPSTSPAMAMLDKKTKLKEWKVIRRALDACAK